MRIAIQSGGTFAPAAVDSCFKIGRKLANNMFFSHQWFREPDNQSVQFKWREPEYDTISRRFYGSADRPHKLSCISPTPGK